jgi:DNA-3-methyladenine glycosylase
MKRLSRAFFARETHRVAKDLLGKLLVHKSHGKTFTGRIFEVEAYVGEDDLASHARFGKTKRNEIMYGQAGHAYIYFIYGMYDMLNIVTDKKNFPAAVLIRGVTPSLSPPVRGEVWNGPGKLTRAMKITRKLNGEDLVTSKRLYVVDDGFRVPKGAIYASPRIGVEYAGRWAKKHWRYYLTPLSR